MTTPAKPAKPAPPPASRKTAGTLHDLEAALRDTPVPRAHSTLAKLVAEGLPRLTDKSFDVADVVAWLERRAAVLRAPERTPERRSLDHWNSEHRRVRVELAQLDLKRRSGELVELKEVSDAMTLLGLEVKRLLTGLGRRIAPGLVGQPVEDICSTIDAAAREILEAVSRPTSPVLAGRGPAGRASSGRRRRRATVGA